MEPAMSEFNMTIDGQAVATDATLPVINPALGAAFGDSPDCSREQLDFAVGSCEKAFASWRHDDAKRREALLACAAAIQGRLEDLAQVLTREQGKPINAARGEMMGAAMWFQATAALEIP